ncbi:MAG: hypothetical protein Q7T65_05370 [Thiobacillus sp.]|nr:hypothetical protein [Thiobacillus sp.]
MNPEQQKSILAIALYAAFADGAKHDREREEIRRIAESLGGEPEGGAARRASPGAAGGFIPPEPGAPDLARLYQDVLLKRISLGAATAALQDPGERQLAYEMAVCVCDADGRQSAAEQRFLDELKVLLKLDAAQAAAFERDATPSSISARPPRPPLLPRPAQRSRWRLCRLTNPACPLRVRWWRRSRTCPRRSWTSPSSTTR